MDNNMEKPNIFELIHTQYHKLKDRIKILEEENKKLKEENEELKEQNQKLSEYF